MPTTIDPYDTPLVILGLIIPGTICHPLPQPVHWDMVPAHILGVILRAMDPKEFGNKCGIGLRVALGPTDCCKL